MGVLGDPVAWVVGLGGLGGRLPVRPRGIPPPERVYVVVVQV